MGVINLSILYTSFVFSCLFLPKIFIQFCGYKWTVALSFIGYIIWAGANGWEWNDTYLCISPSFRFLLTLKIGPRDPKKHNRSSFLTSWYYSMMWYGWKSSNFTQPNTSHINAMFLTVYKMHTLVLFLDMHTLEMLIMLAMCLMDIYVPHGI